MKKKILKSKLGFKRQSGVFACLVLTSLGVATFAKTASAGDSVANKYGKTDPEKASNWCVYVAKSLKILQWKVDPCKDIQWKIGGDSVEGRPLVYGEFGNPKAVNNTTLILAMVHGDEITPFYLALELAHWAIEHQTELADSRIIVAPLVNPDGFFHRPRTRINARGVDVNRNFPTQDWLAKAQETWKKKYHSDPRRFPGSQSNSEPETVFQQQLIKQVKPKKILSIHSPLNMLDYDGPTHLTLAKFPEEYVKECLRLRSRVKAISAGFFPGSLGNFAGQELGIPTLTLELPTSNPRKGPEYWEQFKPGIKTMIEFKVPDYASHSVQPKTQTSKLTSQGG